MNDILDQIDKACPGKQCCFHVSWIGQCISISDPGKDFCEKHIDLKCQVCKEKAYYDCGEASSLVCGAPLCGKSECRKNHRCI